MVPMGGTATSCFHKHSVWFKHATLSLLKGIMGAKKKEIKSIPIESESNQALTIEKVFIPQDPSKQK